MRFISLVFALWVAQSVAAEVPSWDIDKGRSRIDFQGKQFGGKMHGRFMRFTTEIRLDPKRLEDSMINAVVEMDSVDTYNSERDEELLSANWFNASSYATADFVSTNIRRVGKGYETTGWLTMLGVRKEVTFPFEIRIHSAQDGPSQAELHGEATLRRTDFGIGKGEWAATDIVGDEVKIVVEIKATIPET